MNMDVSVKLSLCGAIAVLLAACASGPPPHPPNSALADAQNAISQAEQANASRYAPNALHSARDKLTAANRTAGSGNEDQYDDARRLAREATADADYARAKALAKQARKRAREAQQRVRSQSMKRVPERLAPTSGGDL